MDAGAKNITIEVKNGGKTYIKVMDDGKGIAPDDMEISLERHATSKIKKFQTWIIAILWGLEERLWQVLLLYLK